MEERKVSLELSREQALVFFEWLSTFNAMEGRHFKDQAEERVLFDLEALLEKALITPLHADYAQQLAHAREVALEAVEQLRHQACRLRRFFRMAAFIFLLRRSLGFS
jgi:hypothetical protein